MVLAEDAAQVAAAEEDRARAARAAQAVLLAEVREVRGDDGVAAHPAQPGLIVEPVHPAQARADTAAILQQRQRPPGALAKLAGRVEGEIGRLGVHAVSVPPGDPQVTRVVDRP